MRSLPVLTLVLAALACARPGPLPAPAARAAPRVDHLDERALLLLVSDQRIYEPFTLERALEAGLEVEVATALGRIGDRRGTALLTELLASRRPAVRRAAAFALGRLADRAAAAALASTVGDADQGTAALAVEALGRMEAELESVLAAGRGLAPAELEARVLPSLHLYDPAAAEPVALRALAGASGELRAWAAYTLARRPLPGALPALRELLADPDPWLRGLAARALGSAGGREDLERLRPLLDDPEGGPAIQALRAARRLIATGTAPAPPAWRGRLLELMDDPRPGVCATALEASAAWLLDPELGAALAARAAAAEPWERRAALAALAAGGDPRARDLAAAAAVSPDPAERAAAAAVAATLADDELLAALAADAAPAVRLAALESLLAAPGPMPAAERLRRALADPDPAVRAVALERLAAEPLLPFADLAAALEGSALLRSTELGLGVVGALEARAAAEPAELPACAAALEALAESSQFPVRRRAAEALGVLGRPVPAVGPAVGAAGVETYREVVERTLAPRQLELTTRHGVLRLRLDCPRAPLTCLNFLQLASQGFYDGLVFHRVVPGFVAQGGDPRGDGWGGPGYTLRDEINPGRFRRGVLGMALSGADTGGSQFFITLEPQPHLDGAFTAFGEVVDGEAVLDLLAPGDRIERLAEIGAGVD